MRMRGITPQKEHQYPDLRQDGVAKRFAARVSMIRLNLKRAFRRALRDFICAGNRWGRLCGKLLHRLNDSSWPRLCKNSPMVAFIEPSVLKRGGREAIHRG